MHEYASPELETVIVPSRVLDGDLNSLVLVLHAVDSTESKKKKCRRAQEPRFKYVVDKAGRKW